MNWANSLESIQLCCKSREAERARLTKERATLQKDEAKFAKKLSNPGFLAKAAPEIVEKDTAKLAELRDKLARVEEQLAELG